MKKRESRIDSSWWPAAGSPSCAVVLLAVATMGVQAQTSPTSPQDSVAQSFLGAMLDGHSTLALTMRDRRLDTGRAILAFFQRAKRVEELAALFGREIELIGSFPDSTRPSGSHWYYRFASDEMRPSPRLALVVSFPDSTTSLGEFWIDYYLVAQGNEKGSVVIATDEPEVRVAGESKWKIGKATVWVFETSLIPLEDNRALFAVKVILGGPKELTPEDRQLLAAPIARYAASRGPLKAARAAAKKNGRTLIENIGVALMLPAGDRRYDVLVGPGEWKP